MNTAFERRLLAVWLALSAITLVQAGVDSLGGHGANAVVAASVIVIALVKVRIILREFMEVRHAPVLLRRLTDLWVVSSGLILLGGYFVGMAFAGG